jgi:hypothetical protein
MWLPCSRPCSHASHNNVSVNDGSHLRRWWEFLETLHKLIVEENYLSEQIFNMYETSLFWKQMPERTFIHKEAKSMPGFKVCVSTLYDVRTMIKLPNDALLRMPPCCRATRDYTSFPCFSPFLSFHWIISLIQPSSYHIFSAQHISDLCISCIYGFILV